jgi:hypothetical protein
MDSKFKNSNTILFPSLAGAKPSDGLVFRLFIVFYFGVNVIVDCYNSEMKRTMCDNEFETEF